MKKINIGIFGPFGRMGKDIIEQIVNFDSLNLSFLCEKKNHRSIGKKIRDIFVRDSIKDLINASDVIIDFTTPSATLELLKIMNNQKAKACLVTGTTGYSKVEEKKFHSLLYGRTILRSFNMSIGINLLKNLLKISSKNIGNESEIEIVEVHHNKKRDIPSGTALSLAQSINEGTNKLKKFKYREENKNRIRGKNEIGFASIRGGDVIGEHSVYFFLDGERIELKHIASSRSIFSIGALEAAKWLYKKKPGLYTTMDMVKN